MDAMSPRTGKLIPDKLRQVKRRWWFIAITVVLVTIASVAVVTVVRGGGTDTDTDTDTDDTTMDVDGLIGEKARALIESARPSRECEGEPPPGPAGDSAVALEIARVVDGCFTISTEWVAPKDVAEREKELAGDEGYVVSAVAPEFTITEPGDRRDEQWALDELGVPEGSTQLPWPTGSSVTVAVVDTGIDAGHPDLKGRLIGRNNYDGENQDALDPAPHGTAVAGIIAAQEDRGEITGVAPGVTLLDAVARLHGNGGEDIYNEDGPSPAESINWAVNQGADVINMSFGYAADEVKKGALLVMAAAVYSARLNDVVLVAAAGNCGCDEDAPPVPALFDGVLAVGSAQAGPEISDDSSRWSGVDLIAPGSEIVSTAPGGKYTVGSGTSRAAPHVAAAAAVLRGHDPSLTAEQVTKAITASAEPLWKKTEKPPFGAGAGMLDILEALKYVETTHPAKHPQYSVEQTAKAFPASEAELPEGYSGLRTCATDVGQCASDGEETAIGLLADRTDGGSVSVSATVMGDAGEPAERLADLRRHDENGAAGPIGNVKVGDWYGYRYFVDFARGGDTAPAVEDVLHIVRGNVLLRVAIATPDIEGTDAFRESRLVTWAEIFTVELP